MARTPYLKEKRPDRLPQWLEQDLVFDLINAFVEAKSSRDVTLLLRDLFTTKEIRNLAKRLRIAKRLLSGKKYDEIVGELHCSIGTIAKVRIWLDSGGEGLQRIIMKLPKRTAKPGRPGGIPGYRLPQLLLAGVQEMVYKRAQGKLDNFLDKMAEKGILDKNIREQLSEEFRNQLPRNKHKI